MWSSLIGLPLSNNSMHTTYPRQKTWSVCFVFVNPCHYLWYSKQSLTWKLKLLTFKCLKLLLLIQVYDSPWYLSDLNLLQSLGTLLGTSDVFVLFLRLYSSLLSVFFFFKINYLLCQSTMLLMLWLIPMLWFMPQSVFSQSLCKSVSMMSFPLKYRISWTRFDFFNRFQAFW